MDVDWESIKTKHPYLEHNLAIALNKPYFRFVVGGNRPTTLGINKDHEYNMVVIGCYLIYEKLGGIKTVNGLLNISNDLFWITCHSLGSLAVNGVRIETVYEEILVIYLFNAWITDIDLGFVKLSQYLPLSVSNIKEIFDNYCKVNNCHPSFIKIH